MVMDCKNSINKSNVRLDGDFLVVHGNRDYREHLPKLQERKHNEMIEKYNIEEDTPLSYLVGIIAKSIVPDTEEYAAYTSLYSLARSGEGRWPETTLGQGLMKLKEMEMIYTYHPHDFLKSMEEPLMEIEQMIPDWGFFESYVLDLMGTMKGAHDRVVTINERVTQKDVDWLENEFEGKLTSPKVLCVNKKQLDSLEKKNIEEIIDIRDNSPRERAVAFSNKRREYKQRITPSKSRTHIERLQIMGEAGKTFISLKHINAAYLSGSVALNMDTGSSDMDMMLKRSRCPGKEKCVKKFDYPIDVYCFTERQIENYMKKMYPLVLMAIPLFESLT